MYKNKKLPQKYFFFTKNNHDYWLKNKKVIQTQQMSKKCPKNLKFLVLKIHKGAEI